MTSKKPRSKIFSVNRDDAEPIIPRLLRVLPKKYHDVLLDELAGLWADDKLLLDHFKELRAADRGTTKKPAKKK